MGMHCKYNARGDILNDQPEECRHRELTKEELQRVTHEDPTRESIRDHLRSGYREVIVIVEGIEPTASCTVQARHSYLVSELPGGTEKETHWDMDFVECVTLPRDSAKGLVLDLSYFHALQPIVASASK